MKLLRNIMKMVQGKRPTPSFLGEGSRFRGYVEIEVRNRDGKVIHEDKGDNVVLNVGKTEIMDILRNNVARETSGVVRSLCRFSIGDGGADPSSLLTQKATDRSRSSLYREVWRKDITSDDKPSGNAIQFTIDINSNDLNASFFNPANSGEYINEAGIVASIPGVYPSGNQGDNPGSVGPDDVLITHKTMKSFPFTPGLGITATFKWTLFNIL